MTDFAKFIAPPASADADEHLVSGADACLERFTSAFNHCDLAAMDSELHFPHVMYSGSARLVWQTPGQHPAAFFEALIATGWRRTEYVLKTPVLVSADKVHFLVVYRRCDAQGEPLSTHSNLWIATRVGGRWGIALRSY